VAYWRGLVQAKGWHGRRPVSLAVDLAAGRVDAALAAAAAVALVLTLAASPASAQDAPPSAPDPRIAQTVAAQALRFPAPAGCETVGGWEDGSIVAACDAGLWIAHGPDSDDPWTRYTGPLMPVWIERASA
jgi:hypothetical protein